ncbi:MAG TPA: hypothetical protein VFU81_12895, partial [Thermomicrobiales bacterium]|nr:hypothetical protein [Thermomicrobiales bacterium]
AANAYPRTLSQEQKQSGPFAWTDSGQMQRWSNVPNGAVRRVGSTWGDLSAPRQTALLQAPQTTLSSPTCFRVTAPALVIEDSPQACQPGGGTPSTPHIHGVHRGPADDYRAKYSGLRTAS